MAREFQRGHKARISDLTAGTDLYVGVQISGPGLSFDISCFGLDADERLSDDRYFVFFNQPKTPEESIQLLGAQAGDTESFRVTLDRIPPQIQKLSFTATIDGAGQMSQVGPGYLRVVAGGEEVTPATPQPQAPAGPSPGFAPPGGQSAVPPAFGAPGGPAPAPAPAPQG